VTMKSRLRRDLRDALKARQDIEVKTLRALVAALDDAEAPPVSDVTGEVPRLLLSEARIRQVIAGEIEQRETASREYDRLGHPERAATLRAGADVARRYLN
jgi:uncharacterized protein